MRIGRSASPGARLTGPGNRQFTPATEPSTPSVTTPTSGAGRTHPVSTMSGTSGTSAPDRRAPGSPEQSSSLGASSWTAATTRRPLPEA